MKNYIVHASLKAHRPQTNNVVNLWNRGKAKLKDRYHHHERMRSSYQFGQVHVPQDAHHDCVFAVLWAPALRCSESPQDGQDVPQPEVIMNLQSAAEQVRITASKIGRKVIKESHNEPAVSKGAGQNDGEQNRTQGKHRKTESTRRK